MPDQRRNAANIGDVIKHSLLPELVLDAARHCPDGAVHYVETHAGFYDYSEHLLRNQQGQWSGERAWSLGIVLDHLRSGGDLGAYGEHLRQMIDVFPFVYPGSLKLVGAILAERKGRHFAGFDLGDEQVRSFPASFNVKSGDGYDGTLEFLRSAAVGEPVVFVDPFWTDEQAARDLHEITRLANQARAIAVWYPLTKQYRDWRSCLLEHGFRALELRYMHYGVRPWAGQDLRGAGMAFRGFSNAVHDRLCSQSRRLVAAFAGRSFGRRLLDLSEEAFG